MFGLPVGALGFIILVFGMSASVGLTPFDESLQDYYPGLVLYGAVLSLVSGLTFGVGISTFAYVQGRKFAAQNPCRPEEELLEHGGANHFLNKEGAGGYLWLTNQRILFRSHRHNLQNHELSIPLKYVEEARSARTAGLIPTGVKVIAAGREECFVVKLGKRRHWANEINRAAERETSDTG